MMKLAIKIMFEKTLSRFPFFYTVCYSSRVVLVSLLPFSISVFRPALRPGSARGPLQGSAPRCLLLSFIFCLTSIASLSPFVLLALTCST